ncbi:MAG: hypothetical protein KDE54_26545, partial [Caldilineaceae bacterium]|nr:hypothetical protein [Caldilineaceae bacterium]
CKDFDHEGHEDATKKHKGRSLSGETSCALRVSGMLTVVRSTESIFVVPFWFWLVQVRLIQKINSQILLGFLD